MRDRTWDIVWYVGGGRQVRGPNLPKRVECVSVLRRLYPVWDLQCSISYCFLNSCQALFSTSAYNEISVCAEVCTD